MTHTNQMDILRQYIYPLQREQAAHVVEQYIGGTFLLRASSQPHSIAVTAKNGNNDIIHLLIEQPHEHWFICDNYSSSTLSGLILELRRGLGIHLLEYVLIHKDGQWFQRVFSQEHMEPGSALGRKTRNPKRKSSCKKRHMKWVKSSSKSRKSSCRKH